MDKKSSGKTGLHKTISSQPKSINSVHVACVVTQVPNLYIIGKWTGKITNDTTFLLLDNAVQLQVDGTEAKFTRLPVLSNNVFVNLAAQRAVGEVNVEIRNLYLNYIEKF